MTPTPPARPKYIRQAIYLTPEARARLKELAERTEEGNVSRLVRRLLTDEVNRVKKEDES